MDLETAKGYGRP